MKVINNICGPGTKDISDALEQALSSRDDSTSNMFPMIFAIKYMENPESGILTPHYMYGLLKIPTIIYNTPDEGDNMVYVALAHEKLVYRIGDDEFRKQKGDLAIPKTLKIFDVERKIQNSDSRAIINAEVPKDANIISLYFGDAAFAYMSRLSGFDENERI